MFELIERDLFFCHFLTKKPFIPLSDQQKINWKWLAQINNLVENLDLRIRYYMLGQSGVVCAIDGLESNNKMGFVLGASYKANIEDAAISATIESLRQAYFIRTNNDKISLSINDFLKLDKPNFKDHGLLAKNVEYATQIASLFSSPEKCSIKYPYIELKHHEINLVDVQWMTDNCPFYFAKASSPNAQDLYLGTPKKAEINLKRLSEFSSQLITHSDVNLLPHPFN
jgi:hypothetical protein